MVPGVIQSVKLTELEQETARNIGRRRMEDDARKGKYIAPSSGSDDYSNYVGIAAEMGVHKMVGVYYPLVSDPALSGEPDMIYDGVLIDIKGTSNPNSDLVVNERSGRRHQWDMYVLAIVENDWVHYVGYAYGHDVLRDENLVYPKPIMRDGKKIKRSPYFRWPRQALYRAQLDELGDLWRYYCEVNGYGRY